MRFFCFILKKILNLKKKIKIMEEKNKTIEYSEKIIQALGGLFEENSDFFINQEELLEGDNLTHFFHALGNVVPANIYSQMTGEDVNVLDFNHIANKLCFQYAKK